MSRWFLYECEVEDVLEGDLDLELGDELPSIDGDWEAFTNDQDAVADEILGERIGGTVVRVDFGDLDERDEVSEERWLGRLAVEG